jgi:Fe-S cluster assembly protein SufD
MRTTTLDRLPLPGAKDEGWRGTALRTLEGLRLAPEATVLEPVRLAPLLEAVRGARPDAIVVDGSTGEWQRRDARDWNDDVRVQDDALGIATAPRWVGWTEGFLWSAHLQETLAPKGLVVRARAASGTLVVIGNGGGASAWRLDVEPGATLDVVELRENGDGDVLAASRARLQIGEGATVRWYRAVAGAGARADDVEVHLARNARLELAHLGAAGRLTRTDARVFLAGPSAAFSLHGLAVGEGASANDFRVGIEHGAPATTSQQEYRMLGNHQSTALFHGRVVIRPECPGSEAHQQAPSLLLHRGARVQSRPQLEIHTDEVKCSHGSTVGELDPAALFYLRSRGIDAETARHLLVEGFAKAVLEPWAAVVGREGLASLDLLWKGGVA